MGPLGEGKRLNGKWSHGSAGGTTWKRTAAMRRGLGGVAAGFLPATDGNRYPPQHGGEQEHYGGMPPKPP